MSKADIFKTLANKETWSIEEVLELLCGPSWPSDIIRGEAHQPMGELLETAANQGRFGRLFGPEAEKFLWDIDFLQDRKYFDEPLEYITQFQVHYLRFVDWVEDEDVLDKIQLDDRKREEILKLIETLNNKRQEVKTVTHDIDYQKLVEDDFWSLTDLRIVLFRETYSSRYWSSLYHKYNFSLEALMQKTDKVIQDAALVGRYIEVHKIPSRPPLIDSDNEDEIDRNLENLKDYGIGDYDGIYDTDENGYRSQRYYHTPDLFSVLTLKGFPIPKGLAASLDQNQIESGSELLIKLKENILYLAAHGENPQNVQIDQANQKPKLGFKGEIEQNLFEREGDIWIISIGGEKASGLKNIKGMSYISYLCKNKGQVFHVVDLDQIVFGTSNPMLSSGQYLEGTKKIKGKHVKVNISAEETKGVGFQSIYDISKINTPVDKKTIRLLMQTKDDLDIALDRAMRSGDTEDEKRIQGELEKLKKVLNFVSFGGKGKTDKPEIERIRQRIQRVVKDAINNINDKNPTLGKYLDEHIKTGEYCSYLS